MECMLSMTSAIELYTQRINSFSIHSCSSSVCRSVIIVYEIMSSPKKAAKPKKAAAHPASSVMVTNAITTLKERNGSSLAAIKKFVAANYKFDVEKKAFVLRRAVKSMVEKGTLIQTKGKGASGSFKLNVAAKKAAVKKPKAKKPAAKKPKAKKVKKSPKKAAKKPAKKTKSPKKAKKPAAKKAKKPAAKKAKKPAAKKAKPAKKAAKPKKK